MAFAGSVVHAESLRDDEINNHDARTSSSRDSTTVQAPEEERQSSDERREAEAFRAEADKLIRCPCLDDIRNGACGSSFIGAFRCFILSQEPEKGAECGQKFTELETCMQGNPEMFADAMKKNVVGEDPKLPPVPPAAVRVPEKIAEWSKEF